jgi:hypothetical protein
VVIDWKGCARFAGLLGALAGVGSHGPLLAQQAPACTFDTAAHSRAVAVTIAAQVLRGDQVDSGLTTTLGEILRAGAPFPGTVTELFYPFTYWPRSDSLKTSPPADVFGELHLIAATRRQSRQIAWSDSTADPATTLLIDSLLRAADGAGNLEPLWAAAASGRQIVRLQLVNGTGHSTASPLVQLTVPLLTLDRPAEVSAIVMPSDMHGKSVGLLEISFVVDASGQPVRSSMHVSSVESPRNVAAAIASTMRGRYNPALVAGCPVKGRFEYGLTVRK